MAPVTSINYHYDVFDGSIVYTLVLRQYAPVVFRKDMPITKSISLLCWCGGHERVNFITAHGTGYLQENGKELHAHKLSRINGPAIQKLGSSGGPDARNIDEFPDSSPSALHA